MFRVSVIAGTSVAGKNKGRRKFVMSGPGSARLPFGQRTMGVALGPYRYIMSASRRAAVKGCSRQGAKLAKELRVWLQHPDHPQGQSPDADSTLKLNRLIGFVVVVESDYDHDAQSVDLCVHLSFDRTRAIHPAGVRGCGVGYSDR